MSVKYITLILGLIMSTVLLGCQSSPNTQTPVSGSLYTNESWKTIIPASCRSFYDGCNNCWRSESSTNIACTEKYCTTYNKPTCLDNKQETKSETGAQQKTVESTRPDVPTKTYTPASDSGKICYESSGCTSLKCMWKKDNPVIVNCKIKINQENYCPGISGVCGDGGEVGWIFVYKKDYVSWSLLD